MVGSRLEKIGTIFSRVTGLLRGGALKMHEKPAWYDVYRAFPPKLEPYFGRPASLLPIRVILYPEDSIRAKVHKRIRKSLPVDDMLDTNVQDITGRAIEMTQEMLRSESNLSEEEAVDKVVQLLKAQNLIQRPQFVPRSTKSKKASFSTGTPEAIEGQGSIKVIDDRNVNIKDIFKK